MGKDRHSLLAISVMRNRRSVHKDDVAIVDAQISVEHAADNPVARNSTARSIPFPLHPDHRGQPCAPPTAVRQASPCMENIDLLVIQSVQALSSAPCVSRHPKRPLRSWLLWRRSQDSIRNCRRPLPPNSRQSDLTSRLLRTCPVSYRKGPNCNGTRHFEDRSRSASDGCPQRSHPADAPAFAPMWPARGASVPVRAAPRRPWRRRQAFRQPHERLNSPAEGHSDHRCRGRLRGIGQAPTGFENLDHETVLLLTERLSLPHLEGLARLRSVAMPSRLRAAGAGHFQRLHLVPCSLLPPCLRFCNDVTFKGLDLIGGEDRAGTIRHFRLRGRASSLVHGAHPNVNDPHHRRKCYTAIVFRSRAVSEIPGLMGWRFPPGGPAEIFTRAGSRAVLCLDQLHPLQTRMPVLADDDVVVHGNAERGGDLDDRLGHMDVGLRGRRIAGGMVVHQDQRGRG